MKLDETETVLYTEPEQAMAWSACLVLTEICREIANSIIQQSIIVLLEPRNLKTVVVTSAGNISHTDFKEVMAA